MFIGVFFSLLLIIIASTSATASQFGKMEPEKLELIIIFLTRKHFKLAFCAVNV
jgi:hypothetical protein